MREVSPEVVLVAYTEVYDEAMRIPSLGAEDWESDSTNGADELIEFGGKLCYKSFEAGVNPNVKRVRRESEEYIGNILSQHHGSVLEHASVSFVLINVSRILTHELVRHRAGCAYSQESMRYVRFIDVPFWIPGSLSIEYLAGVPYEAARAAGSETANRFDAREWARQVRRGYIQHIKHICGEYNLLQGFMNDMLALDDMNNFQVKKIYTSAIRRGCPSGVATNILMTANHRAWRHIVEMRSNEHVEEETRAVAVEIGLQLKNKFPNIYQDMDQSADGTWLFRNSKV